MPTKGKDFPPKRMKRRNNHHFGHVNKMVPCRMGLIIQNPPMLPRLLIFCKGLFKSSSLW